MYNKIGKRTLDIIIASIALALFAVPLLILIPFARRDTQGTGILKQSRFGKDRQLFTLYKIRTMHNDTPLAPTAGFTDAGKYISKFGKVLRKISLDEIPQAFNVLKGDMSIIGPRPVILKEVSLIELREQVNANSVRPGITGWAQVNGRDILDDIMKSRFDGEYVRELSFKMDMKCIAMTIWAVASIKGHREGHELATENGENAELMVLMDSQLAIEEA